MWKGSKVIFDVILILSIMDGFDFLVGTLFEGEKCQLSSGSGICRLITECPSVLQMVEKEIAPEVMCGFQGPITVVCCPLDIEATTTVKNDVSETTVNSSDVEERTQAPWEGGLGNKLTECTLPFENLKKEGREHLPWNKCVEYSQKMYRCEESSGTPMATKIACNQAIKDLGGRIINGDAANEKEFPHMALLGRKEGISVVWEAGGTLISEFYILTAAHVLETINGKVNRVRLGQVDRMTYSPETTYGVESWHQSNYKLKEKCYNDIGLIRLDRKVIFSEHIRPACLPSSTIKDPVNAKRTITGWGVTHRDNTELSTILQKVTINVVPPDVCLTWNICTKQDEWEMNKLICASSNGTEDSCQGDSGGPMQVIMEELYCQYVVLGIVSIGRGCGFPGFPAVYTNVSPFLDWIVNITWPSES